MQEKISFQSNGAKIVGVIDLPAKTPCPVIAMFHGATNTKENAVPYQRIVEKLNEAGFATLRIDFFGTGESDGQYLEKTYAIMDQNINDAIEFLASDKRFTKIGALARSQSGGQLLYIDNPKISCRVLHGPSIHPYRHLQKSYPGIIKDLEEHPDIAYSTNAEDCKVGVPNTKGIFGFSRVMTDEMKNDVERKALEVMPKLSGVCLFLGDKDVEKTVEDILEIYQTIQEPKELHIFSNATYKWNGVEEEVAELTASWFKRNLN